MTDQANAPEILDEAELDHAQGGLATSQPNGFRIEVAGSVAVKTRQTGNVLTSMEEGETCTI